MLTIKEISNIVYYNMSNYSQLIINFIEEIEYLLDSENINYTSLEAKVYDIQNILEVINPNRVKDIEILENLIKIINNNIKTEEIKL